MRASTNNSPRPDRRDLSRGDRFSFAMIAQNLTGSIQRGGNSALHASQVDRVFDIVPREIQIPHLVFGRGRFGQAPMVLMKSGTSVLGFNSQLSTSAGVIGRYSQISSNSKSFALPYLPD